MPPRSSTDTYARMKTGTVSHAVSECPGLMYRYTLHMALHPPPPAGLLLKNRPHGGGGGLGGTPPKRWGQIFFRAVRQSENFSGAFAANYFRPQIFFGASKKSAPPEEGGGGGWTPLLLKGAPPNELLQPLMLCLWTSPAGGCAWGLGGGGGAQSTRNTA